MVRDEAFLKSLCFRICPPVPPQGVKSDHERQKEQHAAGGGGGSSGFDSGRTWGSNVPKVCVCVSIVGISFPYLHTPIPAGFGCRREKSNKCWCLWSIHPWSGGRVPRGSLGCRPVHVSVRHQVLIFWKTMY